MKLYENKSDAEILLNGFKEGFHLNYNGPRVSFTAKNLISADMYKEETLSKLTKEVQLGRMLGPFNVKPISNLRVSPIGLVPKPDNGWRLITHLSYPNKQGVNDFIDEDLCKVRYTSFDSVVDMISALGRSALIAKVDISQAFRLLRVNPEDFDLLGIMFDGKYYVEKCLPMGCSISCSLFEKFSTFLHKTVARETGLDSLDHYLDDFLFAGGANTHNCRILMDAFLEVASEMGVPIAENKTVGPTTNLIFLGLEIDTVLMLVRVPDKKIQKLKSLLGNFVFMKKVRVNVLESMLGLMSFCSRAIPSARAFLRRFYDILAKMKDKKPYYLVKVTQEMKLDASVLLEFLINFNGECYILERLWVSNEKLELFTDASGNPTLGCAAYFAGKYVQFRWPTSWANEEFMRDLTFLELVPIVLAMYCWSSQFASTKILFRTDNEGLVYVINKRTSRSKMVMKLVRPLVLFTLCNQTQFKAKHIFGSKNDIADSLSRFQMSRFRRVAEKADQQPSPVPMKFLELISNMK